MLMEIFTKLVAVRVRFIFFCIFQLFNRFFLDDLVEKMNSHSTRVSLLGNNS